MKFLKWILRMKLFPSNAQASIELKPTRTGIPRPSRFGPVRAKPQAAGRPMRCTRARPPRLPARIRSTPISSTQAIPMISTIGPSNAAATLMNRVQPAMFLQASLATKTWTTTGRGAQIPTTGTFGLPASMPDGLRTTMVIGHGFHRGDGLGLTTHRGATHHSTTAAGSHSEADGLGCRGQWRSERSMRRR